MRTGIDRVLEIFDEEIAPDVMSMQDAVDFADELIGELEARRNTMEEELQT